MASGLRRKTIHQAFHQPVMFGGAERKPAFTLGFVCVVLAVNGATLPAAVIAAVLWFAGFPLLRRMAKGDPKMAEIYRRMSRYRGYYPPRSTPWRTA